MSERAVVFHCPYCGGEDLRPHEIDQDPGQGSGSGSAHGAWECRSCLRAFGVRLLGLIPRGGSAPTPGPVRAGGEVSR